MCLVLVVVGVVVSGPRLIVEVWGAGFTWGLCKSRQVQLRLLKIYHPILVVLFPSEPLSLSLSLASIN